jgi:hypothetical protein
MAAADPKPDDAAAIKAAAGKYQKWGRVDERARPAPTDCAAPSSADGEPAHARISQAEDGPHGKKLYFLWSSDNGIYRVLDSHDIPVGFTIVKQSFTTKTLASKPEPSSSHDLGVPKPIDWVESGGKILAADKPKDLFIMIKVGERDGADHGWIYGTVSPDGKVTSSGKVASCMKCHADATHERLFGLAH